MSFWLALGALGALAIALLVIPARRGVAGHDDDQAARTDQLRRLREFEAELAAGEIDAAASDEARRELERAVVSVLPADTAPGATAPTDSPAHGAPAPRRLDPVVTICALLVPLLAGALYWRLGSPDMGAYSARHPGLDWREPRVAVGYLVERVRDRVAAVPDDADAWAMLARTELELGNLPAGLAAAERLRALRPQDIAALLMLIDALAMQEGGTERARARALVDELLALDPKNPSGLTMQGMFLQEAGDAAGAVARWQEAHALAQQPELREQIAALITQAGGTVAGATAKVIVDVEVSLAPELAARAQPDDAVFVAALAVDGPPAPLAVVRRTVADLPFKLNLDDTMAMMPGHSLADAKAFYVVARIARGGTPMPQSGDLEGRSDTLTGSTREAVKIRISRALP